MERPPWAIADPEVAALPLCPSGRAPAFPWGLGWICSSLCEQVAMDRILRPHWAS